MRFLINDIEYIGNLILINDGVLNIFKGDELLLNIPVDSIYSIHNIGGLCTLKNNGMVFDVLQTVLININLYDDVEEEYCYDYLLNYIKEHNEDLILIN